MGSPKRRIVLLVALLAAGLVVPVVPASATPVAFGPDVEVDTTAVGAEALVSADIDGDGDIDLAIASRNDNTIAWYENDGSPLGPTWTKTVVANDRLQAMGVAAADLDGDGDLDLAGASYLSHTIVWYLNDGTPGDPTWTATVVDSFAPAAYSVIAADVDDDGNMDLVGTSTAADTIAWYRNDGTPLVPLWTKTVIDASAGANVVVAVDVDDDGNLDIASSAQGTNTIAWYRNDGTPLDAGWTRTNVATTAIDAFSVHAADIDGDGDADLASASATDSTIAWYENDGTPLDPTWVKTVVAADATNARSVFAADLDGDGDVDLASAAGTTIAWYENDGTPLGVTWAKTNATTAVPGASGVHAADLDGDGDLDLASTSATDNTVAWYPNPNTAPTAVAGGPYTVVSGSSVGLVGAGSSDAQQASNTLGYAWDLDNDGAFDDAATMSPTYSSGTFGVVGANTIRLRVTDDGALSHIATATVTITAAPVTTTTTTEPPPEPTTTSTTVTTEADVTRTAGDDRYATAAALNADLDPGIDVAYIATGELFPDALATGPVAGMQGVALLLVERDELPLATSAELTRLRPDRIVVIGGVAAVTSDVAADLGSFATEGVSRIAGGDRFETALELSRSAFPGGADEVHLASGVGFADAVAAGPPAGIHGGPVLLVERALLGDELSAELVRLAPATIVIGGGSGAVDPAIDAQVAALLPDAEVIRAAGADRYATSVALASRIVDDTTDSIFVATGAQFADALAATPAAIRNGAPIVLVPADGVVPESVLAFLASLDDVDIVVVGGTSAVTNLVMDQLSGG